MKILRLQTGKRAESDTGRKNGQQVMINITMVKFPVIAGYGTYYAVFYRLSDPLCCRRCGGHQKGSIWGKIRKRGCNFLHFCVNAPTVQKSNFLSPNFLSPKFQTGYHKKRDFSHEGETSRNSNHLKPRFKKREHKNENYSN